jgi:dihydrofolate reductase
VTTLVLIAAVAANRVIGAQNALPWHLPEDLRHFRLLTSGHAVIMGRKTWESLPPRFRPLPGRQNIVVSRDPRFEVEGAELVHSLIEAIAIANTPTAFVIGGAELYRHALPLAQRLELTEIGIEVDGDAFFPDFDREEWRETNREQHRAEAGYDFGFATYERR